jgi:hypothetical protein
LLNGKKMKQKRNNTTATAVDLMSILEFRGGKLSLE